MKKALVFFFMLIAFAFGSNVAWAADYVGLCVDGQWVTLSPNAESSTIEFNKLNCEFPLTISVSESDTYDVYFDGVKVDTQTPIQYQIKRLDPNDTIPVQLVDRHNGEISSFAVLTWPSMLPTYTVVGESPYEGDYYLTIMGNGQDNTAMKIDRFGNLKYYYINPYGSIADFKKVETEDGIRYLMFTTISSVYSTRGCSQSGCYVVMDENYHEINRLFMKKSDIVPTDNYQVDQHDCLYISDNEYYLITYMDKNVYNIPDTIPHKEYGTLVSAAVIQGIRDGKVFFEWDSTEFPELYGLSTDLALCDYTNSKSYYAADYMHINSISLDPKDGNLIASFRNIDTVMKINVQDGSIMWKLSGKDDDFGLTQDQMTSKQHYAQYTADGTLTVFDNGNENEQTRIVEYTLNEEDRTLTDFKFYQIDGYFSPATGSVQKLPVENDVFVIGWGTRDVANRII